MTTYVDEHQPEPHFDGLLGNRKVDARVRKCEIHEEGLPPVSAHFLYPVFRAGKPTVPELVKMLVREITGFCATKRQRREAKEKDFKSKYDSREWEDLADWAKGLFIKADASSGRSGEAGELLLYVFIEHYLKAPLVLSKMRLKTSPAMPVHGADGVHAMWDVDGKRLTMFFGESKLHERFSSAMSDAAESIGWLANNVNGRMDNELQLTTGHIDLDGFPAELQEYLLRYLHPYATEEGNRRNDRFAILIGYDYAAYEKLIAIAPDAAEERFLESYRENLRQKLEAAQSHLQRHNVSLASVDIFFLPLPGVKAFRDAFNEELRG
ncbi:hypothetical protein Hrubri_4367 [Herbaspirillum rubrisubalbicans M1]|uniref:HamA C-terminal domain-containing protein n=1 Tax=Herbaspirillum rubrisubalbicans TaxID=80842 RepID=UPI00073A43BF|nr:DUF1837 domain-containing protein [Herbaspirillum rubrisubalbicans]ALU91512.1 hypothetical protein Hrubri_4367 [Herbaspirillum rubrisubalbicans M1]